VLLCAQSGSDASSTEMYNPDFEPACQAPSNAAPHAADEEGVSSSEEQPVPKMEASSTPVSPDGKVGPQDFDMLRVVGKS
jgi:hypothetical protein